MATNNFKAFALDPNANVMSQTDWEALPALLSGFTAGKAASAQVNKALRQSTTIAALVGQFIAVSGSDALDNADINGLVTKFTNALTTNLSLGTASKRNVGTGANQLPDMSSFPAVRGNNGMQQLPNGGGIVDQWGNVTIPVGATTPGYVDVVFPVAFSSAPWFITLNIFSNNVGRFDLSYSNPSATGFRLHWSSTSTLTVAQQFSWYAKGY